MAEWLLVISFILSVVNFSIIATFLTLVINNINKKYAMQKNYKKENKR